MSYMCGSLSKLLRRRDGSSLIETAFLMPMLLLILAGAVDFGRAYYLSNEISSAAHAGAVYGTVYLPDDAGVQTAAQLDAPDIAGLTVTATHGCECFDGSSVIVNCATPPSVSTCSGNNYVNYVQVTTSTTYTPLFPYPGIPSSFTLQGNAYLRSGGD
ncbi:TadE/TadG family type IV pilus assembly protein [Acidicapsa ligni]|uniref:TadE/TadG family type IV pilus assembly protein n=1 Tax=Acidicapsa ligni TaxID=542300 RepID=UPI0021DFDCC0|nr:TadE/TadG family type IV pilus assembly protein [Acidicapsa ligni]